MLLHPSSAVDSGSNVKFVILKFEHVDGVLSPIENEFCNGVGDYLMYLVAETFA